MKRINLTQHNASLGQGCMPRSGQEERMIKKLLTFEELPSSEEVNSRAKELVQIAVNSGANEAMIGGASYLMELLAPALRQAGVQPVHAFTLRDSIETVVNGEVIKRSVFRFVGFVKIDA